MSHFMFYAGRGYMHKLAKQEAQSIKSKWWFRFANSSYKNRIYTMAEQNPIGEAVQEGDLQERIDSIFSPWSAFSYEDLPTDKIGAIFGAEYFNPDSDLSFAGQIYQFFTNELGVTEPNLAPNYSSLPQADSKNPPSSTNKTTNPVYVGE